MASVEGSSSLERAADIPKDSNETRETSAEFNINIQDGGHVVSSSLQQNPVGLVVPTASVTQVGE